MLERSSGRPALALAIGLLASACVYPHRGTPLAPLHEGAAEAAPPADLYRLTVGEARIEPQKRGGLPWDEGGGLPDAFVRIVRDEVRVFESEAINDSLTPRWDAQLPRNVRVAASSAMRFEVWDRDTVGSDPIGQLRTRGLPDNATPGGEVRLDLEGGGTLTIRVSAPRAHRGVGIEEYELRPDALVLVRILPSSPAARSGLRAGESIVAFDGRAVSAMSGAEATTALSMAARRSTRLHVRAVDGAERTTELDGELVWLTM